MNFNKSLSLSYNKYPVYTSYTIHFLYIFISAFFLLNETLLDRIINLSINPSINLPVHLSLEQRGARFF